ncbi:MAG: hypothetical protein CL607_00310 [Anaerolineaceae bacterium]|nr:hypothetical protein [Anaerolineaceae bacterium]
MDLHTVIRQLLPIIQDVIGGALKTSGAGVFGKMREVGSLAGFLRSAPQVFAGSELIKGLVSSLGDLDFSNMDLDDLDTGSVMDEVSNLDDLLSSAGLADEAENVKRFIFGLAENVAAASGSGVFGSGEKVSSDEASYLENLKSTLGL